MNSRIPYRKLAAGVLAILLVLFLPGFLAEYDTHVLTLGLINAIMAAGLNLTLGYVGQPNFGQAAFLGIGAYTSAILSLKLGFPFLLALATAIAVSVIAGLSLGYVSLRLRGAYFCMVTIAISQALMLIVQNLVPLTNGPMGLAGIPPARVMGVVLGRHAFWVMLVLVTAAVLYLTHRLELSVVGRAWVGIRESEPLARSIGIDSFRYALLAFTVGAAITGLAGSLYAHYITVIDPGIFSFYWSSLAVVAVVIGGRGTVWGPVVGSLLVTMLPEYLRMASMWRLPMFGLVLIVVITWLPDGLAALWKAKSRTVARASMGVR